MPLTATEAIKAQGNNKLRYAMDRLLYKLKRFIGTYPLHEDDPMPEHDVQWMAEIGADPAGTILDAIKMSPELWAHAIPEDCIIVPRKPLEGMLGKDTTEALAMDGAHLVSYQADRLRHEAEERERRERYGKRS